MTLAELEYKLALARQQGADNNTEVRFDAHVAPPGSDEDVHLDDPLNEVEFRRNGRYEVVLR